MSHAGHTGHRYKGGPSQATGRFGEKPGPARVEGVGQPWGLGWGAYAEGRGWESVGKPERTPGGEERHSQAHWGQGKQRLQKEGRQSVRIGLRMGP